ncbi:hypothetical protein CLOM_g22581 [Closterium sp. NIES-68]|nr:hypothetical protein CLOM_g22581 [Closterium sp. NIES-68]GJP77426.1 hypothetical protein CLOP_g7821 [Closterium sp. NIES-67]
MADRDFPRGPSGTLSNDAPPSKRCIFDATTEVESPSAHPRPLSASGLPASPNPSPFPASRDPSAYPAAPSLSDGLRSSPPPACLAPRFTQTRSRDDVAADCSMPQSFKHSLDDLCCLNLIDHGSFQNGTFQYDPSFDAPRNAKRSAQNQIFDDFSCLGLGLDDADGPCRSAPQSRTVSPPPAFFPPPAFPPPAIPPPLTGAQVSAFSAALGAAAGAAASGGGSRAVSNAIESSAASAQVHPPQLPRSASPPSPSPPHDPALPLPVPLPASTRPASSAYPSYPLSRESLLRRPTRIILVRHGQSEGNVDEGIYTRIADSRVSLTPLGFEQAVEAGKQIRRLIELDGQKGRKGRKENAGGSSGEGDSGGGDTDEAGEEEDDWGVYFYVSPYLRTLQTLRGIGRAFDRRHILGVREEPRLREQDFGNFQVQERMRQIKDMRQRFGRFFYRFPEGESSADVYDRVTGFLDSLWRDIDWCRLHPPPPPPPLAHPPASAATTAAAPTVADATAGRSGGSDAGSSAAGAAGAAVLEVGREEHPQGREDGGATASAADVRCKGGDAATARAISTTHHGSPSPPTRPPPPAAPPPPPRRKALNIVMVTHGLTTRVFLMRWFRWTVQQFEGLLNPGNCEIRVMEMGEGGKYSLAVRHSEYELFSWGLTPDMIADQHARMTRVVGDRKGRSTSGSPGWLSFFDHLDAPPHAAAPTTAAAGANAATAAAAETAETAATTAHAAARAPPAPAAARAADSMSTAAGASSSTASLGSSPAAANSAQVARASNQLILPECLPTEVSLSADLAAGSAAGGAAAAASSASAAAAAIASNYGACVDGAGDGTGEAEQALEREGGAFAFVLPGGSAVADECIRLAEESENDSAGRILGWRHEKSVAESNDSTPI